MRSVNTSVVALLPVGSILVIGIFLLGPGTLLDLSLALFVGIAAGTYSSIFIATPLLADLREREPGMKSLAARAARHQASRSRQGSAVPAGVGPGGTGGPVGSDDADGGPQDGDGGTGVGPRTGGNRPDGTPPRPSSRPLHPSVATGPRGQPKRPPKSRR